MTIVLRADKGSALTFIELDGNFEDLDDRVDELAETLARLGEPAAFTSRALTAADNGKNLICSSA